MFKPGGLDLSRRGLDRDSQSQHWKKVGLDCDQEILILSRHHLPVSKVLIKIGKSVETLHFGQIFTVCFDLDRELVNFILFLNQDFSICEDF